VLEAKMAEEGLILTEAQMAGLEEAKTDQGDGESRGVRYCGAITPSTSARSMARSRP